MRVAIACALFLLATFTGTGADAQPEPQQCVYGGLAVTVGPVTVSNY